MKLEKEETFKITYFAKKHGKTITRNGKWTDHSKEWISKTGNKLFTYYDLDNQGCNSSRTRKRNTRNTSISGRSARNSNAANN